MGQSYANFFVVFIENEFFSNYNGQKSDIYKRFIDDCVGTTSSSKEELSQFITSVNSFHPALKYTWEISKNSLRFPRQINFQSTATGYLQAYTTNQQIPITTCYIRPLIHNT